MLLQEVWALHNEGRCSARAIASRLKIKYKRVLRILKGDIQDPRVAFAKYKEHHPFRKLHQRARDTIAEAIMGADHPLYLGELKAAVRNRCQLQVSEWLIHQYLLTRLDVAFRKIKKIGTLHNSPASKL
jgi:hypothetical protein